MFISSAIYYTLPGNLALHPSESLNREYQFNLAEVKARMSPLPGYRQHCDPTILWHVSSRSGEACCELLYPVTLSLLYGQARKDPRFAKAVLNLKLQKYVTAVAKLLVLKQSMRACTSDNDNVFISDLWPIRPNRQLGLYADIHERKLQGYAHTQ